MKLFKFLLALALAPLVAGELWTIIDLARASVPADQWRQAWFLSFGAGFATWLLTYILLPRTMWIYVLGHEFTHALAAMMAGGKISSFQVTAKGGHVITDRVNWWITLSPYFVPIYALMWLGLWLTVDFYHPLKEWQPMLYFGLGVLWAFHLTFTFSMLHLRQTDLSSQGYVFSVSIIVLINLFTMLLLLSLLVHTMSMLEISHLFLRRTGQSYLAVSHGIAAGLTGAVGMWHGRGA